MTYGDIDFQKLYFCALYLFNTNCLKKIVYWLNINNTEIIYCRYLA